MADYEVITPDNSFYWLDDGEVFENKLIDFTQNNNWFCIYGRNATNWTVRNVGFIGQHEHDQPLMSVSDESGGTSTIENVYMGDGCIRPDNYSAHGQTGIYVGPEHSGHLQIENVNVQGMPNNGIYANPPHNGGGGTVTVQDCYAANNYVSSIRIGSNGSECNNCVAFNSGNGRYTGRPFWCWGDNIELNNIQANSGGYPDSIHIYSNTNVNLSNSTHDGYNLRDGSANYSESNVTISSNADLSMPQGVPTSGEAAAGGEEGAETDPKHDDEFYTEPSNESNFDHVIFFDGRDYNDPSGCFLTTTGELYQTDIDSAVYDSEVEITEEDNGWRAEFTVQNENPKAFFFNGDIYNLTVNPENQLDVLLDYEYHEPDNWGTDREYEVIEANGQNIYVDSGEEWSNKLIDLQSGNGELPTIYARGTEWVIKNIGIEGIIPRYHNDSVFILADSEGANSRIENVFCGLGDDDSTATEDERSLMIEIDSDHTGHIQVQNVNFSAHRNRGIDTTNSEGSVTINRCYGDNNHHTAFQLSSSNDTLENSVAAVQSGEYGSRGIWMWESESDDGFTIDNVNVRMNNDGTALVLRDQPQGSINNFHESGGIEGDDTQITYSNYDTNPSVFYPNGTPIGSRMAARGGGVSHDPDERPGGDPDDPEVKQIGSVWFRNL